MTAPLRAVTGPVRLRPDIFPAYGGEHAECCGCRQVARRLWFRRTDTGPARIAPACSPECLAAAYPHCAEPSPSADVACLAERIDRLASALVSDCPPDTSAILAQLDAIQMALVGRPTR